MFPGRRSLKLAGLGLVSKAPLGRRPEIAQLLNARVGLVTPDTSHSIEDTTPDEHCHSGIGSLSSSDLTKRTGGEPNEIAPS